MPRANFLDLPAELRNEIYRMVIPSGETYGIEWHGGYWFGCPNLPALEPTLAAINRQVRTEVLSMLYGWNTFQTQSRPPTMLYLEYLGPVRVAMLKDLRPCHYCDSLARAWSEDGWSTCDAIQAMRDGVSLSTAGSRALRVEAVSVPTRRSEDSELEWIKLWEIEDVEVVGEGEQWTVKWKGATDGLWRPRT